MATAGTSCSTVSSTVVDQLGVEAYPRVLMVRMNDTYWTCVRKQHVIVSRTQGRQLGWLRCGACSGRGGGAGIPATTASSSVTTGSLASLRAREGSHASGRHGNGQSARGPSHYEWPRCETSNLTYMLFCEENQLRTSLTFYRRRKSALELSSPFCGFREGVPVLVEMSFSVMRAAKA